MVFTTKEFNSLSPKELFEIYKLRNQVFIVEQNCPYQDVDEKDISSFHLMLIKHEKLVAYCRILPPGVSYKEPSIGRVVVAQEFRKNEYGKILMKHCINETVKRFNNQAIVISAQVYLLKFYTNLGFVPEGAHYLEDDIPHVKMRRVQSV
jgi:ElaA protein